MSRLRRLLPQTARRHRILAGPLRGLSIYTSWRDYPRAVLGRTEAPLLAWIAANARPGETWLDVGASFGYTALALCRAVGHAGRVFAFEPALATAGCLAKTRAANELRQLVVAPLGLGDETDLTLLRVSPEVRGMVGITPAMRDNRSGDHFGENAFSIAFDAVWGRLCGGTRPIAGIKIDVQGSEAPVLRGMLRTLREQRPKLVVEYHDYADLGEVLGAIEAAGYSPVGRDIDVPTAAPTSRLVHAHNYEFRPAGAK